jgi:hypothetical protein
MPLLLCSSLQRPAVSLEFFHQCRAVFENVLDDDIRRQLDTLEYQFGVSQCRWATHARSSTTTLPEVLLLRRRTTTTQQYRSSSSDGGLGPLASLPLTAATANVPAASASVSVRSANLCLRNAACNDLLAGFFASESKLARAGVRLRRWWAQCSRQQLGNLVWRAVTLSAAGTGGGLSGALLGAGVSVLAAQVWRAGGIFLEHTTVLDHVQFGRVFHVALLVLALVHRLAALASSSSPTIAGVRDSGVLRLWIRRVCVALGLLGGVRAGVLQCLQKYRRRRRAEWLLLQWRRTGDVRSPSAASPRRLDPGDDADDSDDDTDMWWLPHTTRASFCQAHDAAHLDPHVTAAQQKPGVTARVKDVSLAFGEGAVAVYKSMYRRGATVHVAQRYHVLLTVLATIAELM